MSSRSTFKLFDLPPELVTHIVKQIGRKKDRASVRMVCTTLAPYAAKELFAEIGLSQREENIIVWNEISEHDIIRYMPRHAVIQIGYEDEEHEEDFKESLNALLRFSKIDSLEICVNIHKQPFDFPQYEEMLKMIFQAIGIKNKATDETKTIRKLTIIKLQHFRVPNLTASDVFREVMSQLEELHISVAFDFLGINPGQADEELEMQAFPPHLVSDWVALISAKLKELSIYHEEKWGPLHSYFGVSSLYFPNLRSLALGFYTLANDGDIDWILRIKGLRRLILHNCMITSWIAITKADRLSWDPPMNNWTHKADYPDDAWVELYSYDGTWAREFDRIAANLPNLIDFRFDMGLTWCPSEGLPDGEHVYDLAQRYSTGTRAFPMRYTIADWFVFPWDSGMHKRYLKRWLKERGISDDRDITQKKGDQTSLDRLMETLRARR